MSVMAMNALVRRAITLVSGVDIYIVAERIHMDVRCSVPWFKVSVQACGVSSATCVHGKTCAWHAGR